MVSCERLASEEAKNIGLRRDVDDLKKDMEMVRETKTDLAAIKESTRLAKENIDFRLNSMNEFRGQLKDQAQTFLTRSEYEARLTKVDEDIRILRESRAELQGKASTSQVAISLLIAVVGIVLSIIAMLRF